MNFGRSTCCVLLFWKDRFRFAFSPFFSPLPCFAHLPILRPPIMRLLPPSFPLSFPFHQCHQPRPRTRRWIGRPCFVDIYKCSRCWFVWVHVIDVKGTQQTGRIQRWSCSLVHGTKYSAGSEGWCPLASSDTHVFCMITRRSNLGSRSDPSVILLLLLLYFFFFNSVLSGHKWQSEACLNVFVTTHRLYFSEILYRLHATSVTSRGERQSRCDDGDLKVATCERMQFSIELPVSWLWNFPCVCFFFSCVCVSSVWSRPFASCSQGTHLWEQSAVLGGFNWGK